MNPPVSRSRRTVLSLAGVAALGSLAGCLGGRLAFGGETTENVEESVSADSVTELTVRNLVGDVTVVGTDTDRVTVAVRKRSRNGRAGLDAIDVRVDRTDGRLAVVTEFDRRNWLDRDAPVADVTVTVPAGDAGPAVRSIYTDIGDVDLRDVRGDAVVRTDLGDVTASGVDGYLTLESELGNVEAGDVTGLDRVFTELGDVKVDLLGVRGDVAVGTDLGNVVVGVADDLDLEVLAESEGSVSSDLSLSALESSARRIAGRLNAGGSRLTVSSHLGDVDLRTLSRTDR